MKVFIISLERQKQLLFVLKSLTKKNQDINIVGKLTSLKSFIIILSFYVGQLPQK